MTDVKACCADLYQSDLARALLGDSFHPGGEALTRRMGELLELRASDRVLDVASGPGTSALALSRAFGCATFGVDLGAENVARARLLAAGSARVSFELGDAERLPVEDGAL